MGEAEREVNVKASERMDRGIDEAVEGRIEEKVGEQSRTRSRKWTDVLRTLSSLLKCPLARRSDCSYEAGRWQRVQHQGNSLV